MNPPPGLKLWIGTTKSFRSSLPDYQKLMFLFLRGGLFLGRGFLCFFLCHETIPPFDPLTRWVGEGFFLLHLPVSVIITLFLSNVFLTSLKLFSRVRVRLFFLMCAKSFSIHRFAGKLLPHLYHFPCQTRFCLHRLQR